MTDWEKLASDPDLKSMWEDSRLTKMVNALEKQLKEDHNLSTRERLYKQGVLAGLNTARQTPLIELDLQRERRIKAAEAEIARKHRPFTALRFTG